MTDIKTLGEPIINSPYEEPSHHWHIEQGRPPQKREGRRPASYFFRVPERAARGRKPKKQVELFEESERGQEYRLENANLLRQRLQEWRRRGYENATRVTRELLQLWESEDRRQRLFFAQREAAETVVFLTEGPQDLLQGIEVPLDRPGPQAQEAGYRAFLRYALKMATGSGKTTVIGMLAAWTILNKVADRHDRRYSDTVLIICPNVTIRERLQELDPNRDALSLYRTRELVPLHLMPDLRRGEVLITNWHNLERREVASVNGTSARVVKRGVPVTTVKTKTVDGAKIEVEETRYFESDEAYLKRLLGGRKGRSHSIFVFNDEAHHAYRRGDTPDEEEVVLDEETARKNDREATVWIEGLDRINKTLGGRSNGIRLCVDCSATPFYIQGSGNEVGKPFPWVVSDFGLMEAIEAGLVKIPQLPTHDVSGEQTPPYFNIWRWVEEQARKEGYGGALTPPVVLRYAAQPIMQMASEWQKTFALWQSHHAQGLRRSPAPPVFIIVCRDTALASEVYHWLANGIGDYGIAPECFRNARGREVAIRIDSKVGEEIEAGSGRDEVQRLRYCLDTVGKTAWPGERVPEDYSHLVHTHNQKALDDERLDWIDETVPPGRDVRLIISVAMLSEGWDATTVTHVVGLRPFGSQLLCEQVVGRALRRTSYDVDDRGLFTEETAKVFGVPFELIPFKVSGTESPPPTPAVNHVFAVKEKAHYAIAFPVVEGYRDPGLVTLSLDWARVPTLTLDPLDVPDAVLVKGLTTTDGRLAVYGPGASELVSLAAWRQQIRPQQVAFALARALTQRWLAEKGEAIPVHRLFPQLLVFARRFLAERLICHGDRQASDVALSPYYPRAMDAVFDALAPVDRCGQTELPIIPHGPAGVRSTTEVDFHTGRDLWPVQKCHLNAMVADTAQWEQSAAFVLDTHPGVASWVKNDHLGLQIPYRKGGMPHQYLVDFIVRLDSGLSLLVEIKGLAGDDAEIKQAAARRWVNAVNRCGEYGQWDYGMVRRPTDLSKLLDSLGSATVDRALERLE